MDKFDVLLEALSDPESDDGPIGVNDTGETETDLTVAEETLSEDVPWEAVAKDNIPPDAKKVVSAIRSANGAVLSGVYRFGGDIKLVFSRPGGLYLNKYNMQKLVKVLGRDEDVLGDSTRNGFVVILH